MKAKHIAFLSLSVLTGTFASCTGSHEIKITGSVKNLDGGTIIYQKSIDGMFNSQSQDTLKLNTDSTFSLTLPSNGYEQIRLFLLRHRDLIRMLDQIFGDVEQQVLHALSPADQIALILLSSARTVSVGWAPVLIHS